MPRRVRWVLGLLVVPSLGAGPPALSWAPDGRWLAYTVEVRPSDAQPSRGWLFRTEAEDVATAKPEARNPEAPTATRLWATRSDAGLSILLSETSGLLTVPDWNAEGTALAFGRLSFEEDDGAALWEVVVQDALNSERVVLSRRIERPDEVSWARLRSEPVAWSPDGLHLAVPRVEPDGLAIVRGDTGRVVAEYDAARLPSWSPDGARLSVFQPGATEGLYTIDTNFGAPRLLAPIGPMGQPAVWTSDGQAVLTVRSRQARGQRVGQLELVRVNVANSQIEPVRPLVPEPFGSDQTVWGVSYALDPESEQLFFSAAIEGRDQAITWMHAQTQVTYKMFPAFDRLVPHGALAVSPADQGLAFRVGPPERPSPPTLCDPKTERLTPLVPDDAARVQWVATILETMRTTITSPRSLFFGAVDRDLLAAGLERRREAGRLGQRRRLPAEADLVAPEAEAARTDRPTLLPFPDEWPENDPNRLSLQRLARLGRPLCERPEGSAPVAEPVQAFLEEARLVFEYVLGDHAAALATLERLEPHIELPDQRLRLLGLRAQLYLALGETDRARTTIAYIQNLRPYERQRIEPLYDGRVVLTAEERPGTRWPQALAAVIFAQQ